MELLKYFINLKNVCGPKGAWQVADVAQADMIRNER
jgi:hypothetical protein